MTGFNFSSEFILSYTLGSIVNNLEHWDKREGEIHLVINENITK